LKLTELIGPAARPSLDPEILGISADSRKIGAGFLFASLPGTRTHGGAFAAEAVAQGAVAILTGNAAALALSPRERARVAIVTDPDPRRRLGLLAARFHGRQPRMVAAVTGTNGKTSVAHFTREIWSALGHRAASLGTLGLVTATDRRPGTLTTPDPVALHRDLAALAAAGVEHVAIEASSHGLDQRRLDGISAAAAAFTNLTRDHLDYHGDMALYRAAKDRLFTTLMAPGGTAVLNADSEEFARLAALCRDRDHPVLAYGADPAAALRLVAAEPRSGGQVLVLDVEGRRYRLLLPLPGTFQAMNVLAALGLAIATGASAAAAVGALAGLSGVPGRMQTVVEPASGGRVIVDYAHTPDALETVLTALRPHAEGRLIALFGAGGDRDPGKRPMMGAVAARLADRVYVTDDNPRSEQAGQIRRDILAAAPGAIEIGDRRSAITAAIAELRRGDILVLAGKGHETGQIVGREILPFDDAEIACEVVRSTSPRSG